MHAAANTPSLQSVQQGDEELVRRALGGDPWAKDALFGRHVRPVLRRLTRLVGDGEEAADLTQDALASAYAALHRLRDPGAFGPWLMQIAVRRAHDALRKRRLLRLLGLYQPHDAGALAELAVEGASAEQRAELALLDRTLATLAPADRIAWTLRFVEGEQLEEVARLTRCSLATAKRRIKRAQERIQAHVALEGEA